METPYDKLTRKEKLHWLVDELSSAEEQIQHLGEFTIPRTVEKLRELTPTKKEIKEYDLNSLLDRLMNLT